MRCGRTASLSEGYRLGGAGHPLECVAWLANTLGATASRFKAGDIILSGSLVPLEPVVAGDVMLAPWRSRAWSATIALHR
jgi:2-oxopent-4-enoate/cis-2-oxohex-4-enoate hydratase